MMFERKHEKIAPNSPMAAMNKLDDYLISIGKLKRLTEEKISDANFVKRQKPWRSWTIPKECDKE